LPRRRCRTIRPPRVTAMRLRIHLLYRGDLVTERLQRDGWNLQAEGADFLSACHAAVDGELAARLRLQGLGLLTSAALRIEFPFPDGAGRGACAEPARVAHPTGDG